MTTVEQPVPAILSLARDVLRQTEEITEYLKANDLPALSFDLQTSSVPPETVEYQDLHNELKTSLEDLLLLVDGPKRFWRRITSLSGDLAGLQVALDFGFFTLVPAKSSISVPDLARKSGVHVELVGRIVRHLITHGIFAEHQADFISHTPHSLIMQDDEFRSIVYLSLNENLKAAADTNDLLRMYPGQQLNSSHNPFVFHHGSGLYEYHAKSPERSERFAKAMAGLRTMNSDQNRPLEASFDWVGRKGTIVDVGGGNGHISRGFARRYPNLNFVVQDISRDMLSQGMVELTDDIRDRVSFVEHSFFDPQPPLNEEVSAFLLRQCTHNWPDPDVVTIFKGLVPGLEGSGPETPLLINEIILPALGELPRHRERLARQVDMVMMVNFGARQRTKAEFEALLKEADPRYEIRNVFDGGLLGVLEVYLVRV